METIDRRTARRFLVSRQLLDPPRSLAPRAESVLEVVERLGSLQFDPLVYPGARNHDLVLHARIRGYEPSLCARWLYGPPHERRLFEAYNKSLNILPLEELPYYRLAWERAEKRYANTILKERPALVAEVLGRIRDEGPLSTAAFKGLPAIDWHWGPTAAGRAALEALFETGKIGIATRDESRRTYDLIERLFPREVLERRVSPEDAARHRLLSRYRGHGLLGKSGSSEIFHGAGPSAARARIVDALVAEGALAPVRVLGVKGERYVVAKEVPLLHTSKAGRRAREVTFVAPLDPLLWDRKLLKDLFDFDYIWEVYTPEHKRRHGYYVLPILFGDELVGRIEPRFERGARRLDVLGVWFEPGFDFASPAFVGAFGRALDAYKAFVRADKVVFSRAKIARALSKALSELRAPA